jgi:hypothetical protein
MLPKNEMVHRFILLHLLYETFEPAPKEAAIEWLTTAAYSYLLPLKITIPKGFWFVLFVR